MTRYTPGQLATLPWIVSTDTLRTEDLLVRYWQTAEQLGAELCTVLPALQHLVGEDSRESDWDDDMACGCLLQLGDILQDVAPSGFYFGASEGDGACFGFWLCEDWADALEDRGIDCEDPAGTAELIQAFEDHGIEAENLCDAYCGTADGYSEAQAGAAYAEELADGNGLIDRQPAWPYTCIDWADAWRELEIGDGYSLIPETPSSWHVVRSV